jgi:predicted DNA-binding transcriptional regulator YafY
MKTSGKRKAAVKPQGGRTYQLNPAALERVITVHYLLQNKTYPNASTIAHEFDISKDTAERMLNYMKDRLGFPMEYDRSKHGWYYSVQVDTFPAITLGAKDIFGLTILDEMLKHYEGTPFYLPLRAVFDTLIRISSPKAKFSIANADQVFCSSPIRSHDTDVDKFNVLRAGVEQCRVVKVMYRRHGTRDFYERLLMPLSFTLVDGRWYLLADSPGRGKVHTYLIRRIQEPKLQSEKFKRPKDFNPSQYTKGAFRILSGKGNYKVELEFDFWGTDVICDRIWHETQQLLLRDDGTSRLTMQLSELDEVNDWLLSHRTHVTVVGPPELKAKRREAIHELAMQEGLIPIS